MNIKHEGLPLKYVYILYGVKCSLQVIYFNGFFIHTHFWLVVFRHASEFA